MYKCQREWWTPAEGWVKCQEHEGQKDKVSRITSHCSNREAVTHFYTREFVGPIQ